MAIPAGAFGQAPPSNYRSSGAIDPYGNPLPGPHGYRTFDDSAAMRGGFTGPFPMGEGGTCPPNGYDLMNDVGMEGFLVDQRGPHYFDVRAEAVYLERDETFERNIDFTSRNIGPPIGAGPIVLSSRDLEYDPEVGFRIVGRYDIDPLAVFEFGYMGIFDYEDSATATSNLNELFSLFSSFGNPPPFGNAPPNVGVLDGPMRETERASRHSIEIESDIQTAELSYRRYWVGYIPRISGTLLAGFRYTRLNEEFLFATVGSTAEIQQAGDPLASLDYTIDADNHLAGFQTGGDIWIGLIQGLRLGGEGKVGLYNNHYTLENRVESFPGTTPTVPPTPSPDLFERFRENQPALIAEASVDLVADILPSWSLRVGYEVLFINSIVLAGDNFNTGSPFNQGPVDNTFGPLRVPFVDDQNDVLYHGGHVGLEYIW
ncbi:MAG: BBP7 family outer membrane beta-barrel protein [Pirellulales bacterium]